MALGDAAVERHLSDHALEAALAFEMVGVLAAETVRDYGRLGLVIKAVGQRAGSIVGDDLARFVIGVRDGFAPGIGVGGHAAHQLGVIPEATLHAGVACVDGHEFSASAVLVSDEGVRKPFRVMRIMCEVHRHQAHAAVCAPAVLAVVRNMGQLFELQAVLPARSILHSRHRARCVASELLCPAEAVGQAQQMQTLALDLCKRGLRPKDPPGTQRVVGDEEERGIAPIVQMQSEPRRVETRGRHRWFFVQALQSAAHDPKVLAATVCSSARRQGIEADAAAFAVVQGQLGFGLQ